MTFRSEVPTAAQLRVLCALSRLTRQDVVSPTIRELQNSLGFQSTNSVRSHLELLIKKKLVEKPVPNTPRGLKLTDKGHSFVRTKK